MPFVSIRIVEGHSKERKDAIARRITSVISEETQIPGNFIWITFEDIPAAEWYIGAQSVEDQRAAAKS